MKKQLHFVPMHARGLFCFAQAFGVRTRPRVALAHGPSIIRISTSADVLLLNPFTEGNKENEDCNFGWVQTAVVTFVSFVCFC